MSGGTRDLRLAALTRFAIAITVLNVVGHLWLGFEQSIAHPLVSLAAAYATEILLETLDAWAASRPRRYAGGKAAFVRFLLPAHITGLACAMLLYTNSRLMPIAFASAAAIASKYVLRIRVGGVKRHVMNPSNFGISATLLAFPWIGIAMPYMFTESLVSWGNWVLPAVMITSGTLLNLMFTKRLPLIVSWVGAFVLQAYIRSLLFDGVFLAALMPMTGVAFILFTFYMVTDPATTPMKPRGQLAFGAAVAAAYGTFMALHVVFGIFYSLTLVCLGRGVLIQVRELLAQRARLQVAVPVGVERTTA